MSKYAVVVIALAVFLGGCTGTQYSHIPVVESGVPLTPGTMRDSRVRQSAEAGHSASQTTAVTARAQELENETVQTYAVPSAPIGGIKVHTPESEPAIATASSSSEYAAPALPIGGQARLAADEQLDGPVLALLTTAKQQQTGGDYNGAASSLERAQRIAPREPQVLYRLAEVRLAQGDAGQAEQLAQRALGYSNGRSELQAGLWDLIARARAQQGNTTGAQEAERRARVNL